MNKAVLIGLLIVSGAMGFTLWAFSSSMTPYVDIHQAEQMGTRVQVRGKILHNTAHWSFSKHTLNFMLQDSHKDEIEVVYHGPKPESFDTAPETAATGIVQKQPDGTLVLESSSMVVKCPSKYDDETKSALRGAYGKA